jgi:polysaccharide pyruvyl transferase CsaB
LEGNDIAELSKIVLAGYYGCGNMGDDALLIGLLTAVRDLPIRPIALAGEPEKLQRLLGVPSIDRRNFEAIGRALEDADALVFGGGGILQDATSIASIRYYTKLIHFAKKKSKRVVMLGQGVGPITSYFGKQMATNALKLVDEITVRDSGSLNVLRSLGIKRPIEVTADLAWLAEPDETPDAVFGIGDMKAVGIAARPWGRGKAIAEAFGGFAHLLYKNQYVPVLVEMDNKMDTTILDQIAKLHGGRAPDMRNIQTPGALLSRLRRMHSVVAMRLHAGILSASVGVPPMMVAYDPKINAFTSAMDLGSAISLEGLTADTLWANFQKFEAERPRILETISRKATEQKSLALKNVDILKKHLPSLSGSA